MAKDKTKTEEKSEKPKKEKKAKKPLTAEQFGKWGKREMRFAAKFGKLMVDEADARRAASFGKIQNALSAAATELTLLGKK